MKRIGIDTVILIRCGHKRWMTYPSAVLKTRVGGYNPPIDLVDLFLNLSEKYDMFFYFGIYDSGRYWNSGQYLQELEINRYVIDEAWQRYGHRKAFSGWYLSQEVSRREKSIITIYSQLGDHCKSVSGGLPVMISPYIDGVKSVAVTHSDLRKTDSVTPGQHRKEWNEILSAISGVVDIVAFQDGHCEYDQLPDYLEINKELAEKNELRCWTNCESFDRDMPIKFLPIKWEKLRLKLEMARQAGIEKAITFEFSHFLSPNSCYRQARHLYRRYCEFYDIDCDTE